MRAAFLALLTGCALTTRSKPVEIRYYEIETSRDPAPREVARACEIRVRIGNVEPDSHLRERIASRVSETALVFYEDRRWTEVPDVYVRRALEHALFEQQGFLQALGGAAPTLDIEITAFEEVRSPHAGRVELRYRVRDDRTVIASDEIAVERAVTGRDFEMVVDAIGAALDAATDRVAEAVARLPAVARCP